MGHPSNYFLFRMLLDHGLGFCHFLNFPTTKITMTTKEICQQNPLPVKCQSSDKNYPIFTIIKSNDTEFEGQYSDGRKFKGKHMDHLKDYNIITP